MVTKYQLPKWGLTMEEGTIVEHRVRCGTAVNEGDVLASVETEKIEIDFTSPASGILAAWLVARGETVPVGADLVVIADDEADYAEYVRTSQE